MQTFVCPDCRCVHSEPAEAAYLLAMRCGDCELAAWFHAEALLVVTIPKAA